MPSQDVSIREARPGEERAIRSMYEWLFAAPGVRPPHWDPDAALERLNEAIVAPQSTILVAEGEGALIGFCTAYVEFSSVRFGRRCWVEDLAVDPERRSLGVGSVLLAAAREWARSAGATHLELDSGLARPDAHRFYEREGGARQSYTFGWDLL
jgi:GNAT superfamily N-acetyltransferase